MILQVCLSAALDRFISNEVIDIVVGLALGAAIYAAVLDTTMLRGFIISILATLIMVVAVFVIARTVIAVAA